MLCEPTPALYRWLRPLRVTRNVRHDKNMKTKISISLLTCIAFCSLAGDVLEFKLAQEKEHPEWNKTECEGRTLWIKPIAEISSQHVASAEVVPGYSFYTQWLTFSEAEQAEIKQKFPDMISEMSTNTPPPCVIITFTEEGEKIIKKTTSEHLGDLLVIVCEDKILMISKINEPIIGNSAKVPTLSESEAKKLVSKINTNIKVEQIK